MDLLKKAHKYNQQKMSALFMIVAFISQYKN